jgi:predicted transcriptional regulator
LDRPGLGAALGDLEAELMESVWRRPAGEAVTVREVWEALYPSHPVMYTTVMNTMTRLARKGLLVAEKKGIAFAYTAQLSRDAFVDRFVGGALERLLANFSGTTQARLKQIDDPEMQARLAKLLEEVGARRASEQDR